MDINAKLLKQLDEARYLTVDNAWRYRTILRFFYLQYEKMRYWMYKEDVYEELKKHSEFEDYTMDTLKQDLEVLVQWKNLLPMQDTSKVYSVEEFKNKQFRYQLSEYSVEIERLTIKLENLFIETASLEPSLLERLRIELEKFPLMASNDEKTVGAWWNALNNNFKRLNQNYQDYIRDFYSIKAEELMKTHEFLVFKDKFIDYLRDFIKGLQYNSGAIENILRSINRQEEAIVLEKIHNFEINIPRMDFEIPVEAIKENIYGRWESLKNWFLGENGKESEAEKLLGITNEIIRKITRYASQISESRNSAANRKEEYKKLCTMFILCETIEEAHKLSAVSFGIFNMRHIKADMIRQTESINSGIYDEEAFMCTIKPRIRNYKEKTLKSPIADNQQRKADMLEKIIKEREEERQIIESYIKENQIVFAELPEIDNHIRSILLRWLARGLNSPSRRSKTEHGRIYRILDPENSSQRCVLHCSDGAMDMPAYVLKFEE